MLPQNSFTLTFSRRGVNINTMKLLIIASQGWELSNYFVKFQEVNTIKLQIFECKNKFIILMFAQVAFNYNINKQWKTRRYASDESSNHSPWVQEQRRMIMRLLTIHRSFWLFSIMWIGVTTSYTWPFKLRNM